MADETNWERAIIEAGRKALLAKHHPDRATAGVGRSEDSWKRLEREAHENSVAINNAAAWLLEIAGRLSPFKGQKIGIVPPGPVRISVAEEFERAANRVVDFYDRMENVGKKKRRRK